MRILDFGGEIPKLKPQALPQSGAQLAVNVDLYGGLLRPHRQPGFQQYVVDELGSPYPAGTTPAMFAVVGDMYVGFPVETHWVIDPSERAGWGTILFVREGKLWRLSPRMVRAGTGATLVGIDAPENPPEVAVAAGQGCKVQWDERCQPRPDDCDEHADAPEVRGYRMTYVNECGEESAPSDVSALVDVRNGDGVWVVDSNTPPANAVKRRYYRSATTTDGNTVWLYVSEDVIADKAFLDDYCPDQLGEVLPTEHHEIPFDCIEGIALGRNMQTVIWAGDQFLVSEPRAPHAYTAATRVKLPYRIVFIAAHTPLVESDTHYEIAIATEGYPYAAQIRDDAQTTVRELAYWYPALSPFGWTVYNGQVFYPAEAGIVSLSRDKVSLVTDEFVTEREWAGFFPRTMRLTGYDQRLFAWYTQADRRRAGLLLVLPQADRRRPASLSRLTLPVVMARATVTDGMALLIGTDILAWGTGQGYMRYDWWSKVEVNAARWLPTVFKAVGDDLPEYSRGAQSAVHAYQLWRKQFCDQPDEQFFDKYPEHRPYMAQILNDSVDVEVTLYCDGREYYNRRIRSASPVTVPRTRRGIEWSIRVTGTAELRELHLQKSCNDLQNDGGHA